jgi:hypothetical protein
VKRFFQDVVELDAHHGRVLPDSHGHAIASKYSCRLKEGASSVVSGGAISNDAVGRPGSYGVIAHRRVL